MQEVSSEVQAMQGAGAVITTVFIKHSKNGRGLDGYYARDIISLTKTLFFPPYSFLLQLAKQKTYRRRILNFSGHASH